MGGVGERVEGKRAHVGVRQGIKRVFALLATADDIVGPKHAEALRDGCDGFRFSQCELGNAGGLRGEAGDEAKTGSITKGAEDACGLVDVVVGGERRLRGSLVILRRAGFFGIVCNCHESKINKSCTDVQVFSCSNDEK